MATGEIKSCLILCSNLMVSLPDNAVVARALDNLDPLVVIDFFLSETAERADVVLPGSVWCEDEGTTTNLEGRVVKINAAATPPGEARPRLARSCRTWRARLGRGQFFPYRGTREIWDELRVASQRGHLRLLRHHLGEDRRPGRRLLALPHRGPSGHAAPVHRALRRTPTAGRSCSPIRYAAAGRGAERRLTRSA